LVPMQGSAITYAMIILPVRDRQYHRAKAKHKAGCCTIEAMDVLRALYGQFDPARPLEVKETDLYVNWQEHEVAGAGRYYRSCLRTALPVLKYPFAGCLQATAALEKPRN
jgi:hypothetical protein